MAESVMTQTKDEIRENGIMAGMTVHEISDFMDSEFHEVLLAMAGTEHFDKVLKLRWLNGNALMYAHSDGLFEKHMKRAAEKDG